MNKLSFSLLVFTLVFAASHAALAETYYEILQRQYTTANDDISESDFHVVGHPLARTCVEVQESKPMVENYVMIHKYKRIVEGEGPVLPRTEIIKVLYRAYVGDAFADRSFDSNETQFLTKEIVTTNMGFENKKVWALSVKKEGEYLFFKREVAETPVRTFYGYCFNRSSVKGKTHELF